MTAMPPASSVLPTFADVKAAAERIKSHALVTPLLRAPAADAAIGAKVLIKPETLQRTGSFKFRGAFNRLVQLSPEQRKGGVVAFSSGNHAQGVAAAAQLLGIKAVIVMPKDAPAIKIANTRAYGAEVITYDRATEDREAISRRLCDERGAVLVPAYDDFHIISGQGTTGLEIIDQAKAMGETVDDILVPVGGGGLIAGIGLAVLAQNPKARIYAVEPKDYDDTRRSLASGKRERNATTAAAFCDSLLPQTPGELTWALNSKALAGGYAVTDDEVRHAIGFAFRALKLVVEPGGVVPLAALLAGHHKAQGRTVVAVLSGGNVDPAVYATCLEQ